MMRSSYLETTSEQSHSFLLDDDVDFARNETRKAIPEFVFANISFVAANGTKHPLKLIVPRDSEIRDLCEDDWNREWSSVE
jgi:hypothetical protein